VVRAFETAGVRLKACASGSGSSAATPQGSLSDSWVKLKPRIDERELQRNPDLAETDMDLVFNIERQTAATCGAPTGADQALLLIAKQHERN
jgi:hypothetical protein